MEYIVLAALALLVMAPSLFAQVSVVNREIEANRRNRQSAIDAHNAVLAQHRSAMELAHKDVEG